MLLQLQQFLPVFRKISLVLDVLPRLLVNWLDKKLLAAYLSASCFSNSAIQFFRISLRKPLTKGLQFINHLAWLVQNLHNDPQFPKSVGLKLKENKKTLELSMKILNITVIILGPHLFQ